MPQTVHVHTTKAEKSYVRCPLCSLKFQTAALERMRLQIHRGGPDCLKRQAEKAAKRKISEATNAPVSVPAALSVTGVDNLYAAVVDDSGTWTQQCDRCKITIKLGRSYNRGSFEAHRKSNVCEKMKALKVQQEKLEKQKNLMGKFLKRTPSRTILESGGASGSTHNSKGAVPPSPLKKRKHYVAGAEELKPSDANLATLARDVKRALEGMPKGHKQKSSEGSGSPQKKPKISV